MVRMGGRVASGFESLQQGADAQDVDYWLQVVDQHVQGQTLLWARSCKGLRITQIQTLFRLDRRNSLTAGLASRRFSGSGQSGALPFDPELHVALGITSSIRRDCL